MPQTSIEERPDDWYEGQLVESGSPPRRIPAVAAEAIRFGLLVVSLPSDDEDECRIIPAGAAADVDAIATAAVFIGGAAPVVLAAASFDGVIGDGEISPARNITIDFAADADWNATTVVVEGLGEDGEEISENFLVPDNGGSAVTGVKKFSKVTRITIPAQAAACAGTVGVGVDYGAMQAVLGVALQDAKKQQAVPTAVGYAATDAVTVLRRGKVAVWCETACEIGDEAYVRIVAGGGEVRGQFRTDMDGTLDAPDAIRVPGAHFASRRTTAGLAILELNLGG